MKKFDVLNENLNNENKLIFSIEVSLVCLLFGSIFASIILTILTFVENGLDFSFLDGLWRFGLGALILFFVVIIQVFIPAMGLAAILRVTIYLLNRIRIVSKFKLVIIMIIGSGYIILMYFLLNIFAASIYTTISSLLIMPYIFTFCFYTLYRNIWNSKIT